MYRNKNIHLRNVENVQNIAAVVFVQLVILSFEKLIPACRVGTGTGINVFI